MIESTMEGRDFGEWIHKVVMMERIIVQGGLMEKDMKGGEETLARIGFERRKQQGRQSS